MGFPVFYLSLVIFLSLQHVLHNFPLFSSFCTVKQKVRLGLILIIFRTVILYKPLYVSMVTDCYEANVVLRNMQIPFIEGVHEFV